MTLDRRLARIDESLTPTQLVLWWLAEAHSYGDLVPYVNSLLAQDPPVAPLDRLAREAVHSARTSMRGKRPELVDAAVRSALRETVFRFELVMKINVAAHELLEREELIAALFASQLAILLSEKGGKHSPDDPHLSRLEQCRRLTLLRVNEMLASQEERVSVESRYLEGHAALFPEEATRFEKQLRNSQEIAAMAGRTTGLDGVEPAEPEDPNALKVRTGQLVADLVSPQRAKPSTSSARAGRRSPSRPVGCGRSWRRDHWSRLERLCLGWGASPSAPVQNLTLVRPKADHLAWPHQA